MPRNKKTTVQGPMSHLQEVVKKAGLRLQAEPEPPPVLEKSRSIEPAPRETTDEELFTEAMDGIDRLAWRHHPHPSFRPAPPPAPDPENENRKLMEEALNQESPIAVLDHPEYIEGWVGGDGKRFLPNLRNGLYSIQGQIDLHGLTRAEAQIAVEDYIIRMSRFRSCCIKIIHGRGINSPADRATLKESLQRLLSTRRMSRYVVAYASAPSRDGGVGAVYVLLSRQ
jgi:DNA-nicking Smr family endonuclease